MEFNFNLNEVSTPINAVNGGALVLESGRYTFKIKDITPMKYATNGAGYRLIVFEEQETRATFSQFVVVSVENEADNWQIERRTAPLIYRLAQCCKLQNNNWEEELLGKCVLLEVVKATQKRRTGKTDDFGAPIMEGQEVNQLARGRWADIIQPAADNNAVPFEVDDLASFLNNPAA